MASVVSSTLSVRPNLLPVDGHSLPPNIQSEHQHENTTIDTSSAPFDLGSS